MNYQVHPVILPASFFTPAGPLRDDILVFFAQQLACLFDWQLQLDGQSGRFAQDVCDRFLSLRGRNALLTGRNIRAVASLDLEYVLAAKLVVDLEDCVLIDRQPRRQFPNAGYLIAFLEYAGDHLILYLVDDLPVYRH